MKNVKVKSYTRKGGRQEYVKVPVYTIDNAPPAIKEKILEKHRDINDRYGDTLEEDLKESTLEELKKFKITPLGDIKIGYSLSYSQGDGFNFIGNFKYKNKVISVARGSIPYQHERSTTIDMDDIDDRYSPVLDSFKERYYTICKKMESLGYRIIEEDRSDENVAETLRINDYRFDSNGTIMR